MQVLNIACELLQHQGVGGSLGKGQVRLIDVNKNQDRSQHDECETRSQHLDEKIVVGGIQRHILPLLSLRDWLAQEHDDGRQETPSLPRDIAVHRLYRQL